MVSGSPANPSTDTEFEFAESGSTPPADATSLDPACLAARLAHATNAYRTQNGKITLLWNSSLSALATSHSYNMASGRLPLGHAGVELRFAQYPFKVVYSGVEHVAYSGAGLHAPAEALEQWARSNRHKENLLGEFVYQGAG